MQSREFDDILASLQEIVRQAYALGRSDALKQVVDVLKSDGTVARPQALIEHAGHTPPSQVANAERTRAAHLAAGNGDVGEPAPDTAAGPWWARQPSRMW